MERQIMNHPLPGAELRGDQRVHGSPLARDKKKLIGLIIIIKKLNNAY